MSELHKEMGLRMKESRKNMKYTQEQMSEMLNISVKHYGEVERGLAGVSLEKLIEICNILNISLDYLVRGYENSPSFIPQRLSDIYLKYQNEDRNVLLEIIEKIDFIRQSRK
ncbi:MAG: helix-turn-helix domain-containing protein [Lachnospiraceae bacterium]|nr:helix-turn-helix domain-containing protein [Lachnospiraceae bacterium]